MPLDPTLGELSDQQSMTHEPDQPGPLKDFFDYARQPAPPRQIQPWEEKINQAISKQDPRYVPTQPPQQQNWQRWAEEVISNLPFGFIESIEWSPAELALLRNTYGSDKFDPSAFPDRTLAGLHGKAFRMGLKRPDKPEYVRQPGVPAIANSEWKSGLIEYMLKRGDKPEEIAKTLNISERTLRRYLNENLKIYRKGASSLKEASWSGNPSMPSFNLPGEATGDPEYEKILMEFLQNLQKTR